MSYDCFNSSVNITNVLMNEKPLTNMCGNSSQFSVVATARRTRRPHSTVPLVFTVTLLLTLLLVFPSKLW
jgi:hypothetical protein